MTGGFKDRMVSDAKVAKDRVAQDADEAKSRAADGEYGARERAPRWEDDTFAEGSYIAPDMVRRCQGVSVET